MGTPSWIELHPIAASQGPDCRVYRIGEDQSAGDANIEHRRLSISRNGRLWNIRLLKQPHSGLMPANLITLAHFSVSSAISFPNSAGDPGSVTPPRSARRAFILGSWRAALTSLLSLSTISAGVAFGAPTPNQKVPS